MVKRSANRRPWVQHDEEPMRVSPAILARCRIEIEPRWKAILRKIVLPFVALRLQIEMVGEGVHWGKNSKVAGAKLGNFSYFGPNALFSGPVVIGDLTMISSSVEIIGQDHGIGDLNSPMRLSSPRSGRLVTVIEADCWIGSRVIIMEGIRIGRGSVIGAGAIVTRDIAPYSIVTGAPARVIRHRFTKKEQGFYEEMLYEKAINGSATDDQCDREC